VDASAESGKNVDRARKGLHLEFGALRKAMYFRTEAFDFQAAGLLG
jgi:hypothetical protein